MVIHLSRGDAAAEQHARPTPSATPALVAEVHSVADQVISVTAEIRHRDPIALSYTVNCKRCCCRTISREHARATKLFATAQHGPVIAQLRITRLA